MSKFFFAVGQFIIEELQIKVEGRGVGLPVKMSWVIGLIVGANW
jgi:hypothetical protein